jgi:hypothetical protein
MSRKPAVTPYFKAHEATILALLPQMPVRTAVLVLLAGRENYRRKGASIGALLDSLKCPPRTLQNVLEGMVKAGEVLIDGQTVTLTATPLVASSRPLSRPSSMGKKREKKPVADESDAASDLVDLSDLLEEPTTTPPNPPQAGGATEANADAQPVAFEPASKRGKQRRTAQGSAPALPADLAARPGVPEAWAAWVQHRKEKHSPITPTAASGQFKKLRLSPDPVRMLEHSTSNGYTGLYDPRPGITRLDVRPDIAARDNWTEEQWLGTGTDAPEPRKEWLS